MHRSTFALARVLAAALGALLFAAGCSGGSGSQGTTPPDLGAASVVSRAGSEISTVPVSLQHALRPASHPLARGAGWLSPSAKACPRKLYVSSYRLNYVSIYCTRGHNQAPIGQITNGIDTPEGANTDSQGNLYVTNTNANTVTEYAPGTKKPSFTYSAGLSYPAGVAVDSKQNVYVSSLSPASVEVFPQGTNSPILTIGSSQIAYPIDLAIDANANVYVTTYTSSFSNGEIIEFPPNSTEGTNLGIVTKGPGGITLDKAGDIVTADQTLPGVLVFPPGATSPSEVFGQNMTDPDPVRLDRKENEVYAGDAIGNAVYVYDYPSGTLVDTITDGIDGPNGLALDPAAPL
jgi:sugar lactone lactonase YvrE